MSDQGSIVMLTTRARGTVSTEKKIGADSTDDDPKEGRTQHGIKVETDHPLICRGIHRGRFNRGARGVVGSFVHSSGGLVEPI